MKIQGSERADLLERATRLLEHDPRIVAAWLHGSMGRGTHDEWSDIDLWIVVADDQMEALRAERQEYVSRVGAALLTIEAPQNAPHGGAYLLAMYPGTNGPHILDSSWQPLSSARRPSDTTLLFEKECIPTAASPDHHEHPDFPPPTISSAQFASLRCMIDAMKRLMQDIPALRVALGPDVDEQVDLFLSFIENDQG